MKPSKNGGSMFEKLHTPLERFLQNSPYDQGIESAALADILYILHYKLGISVELLRTLKIIRSIVI